MKVKDIFGAVVGTGEFRKKYAIMRLKDWVTELKLLKNIISMAAYCGFTSGFRQSLTTIFEPYPASAIYHNLSKIPFEVYNIYIRRENMQ